MTNPFGSIFTGPPQATTKNPFDEVFSPQPTYNLNTGKGRLEQDTASLTKMRDDLIAIKPVNQGQRDRLAKMIASIDLQLADHTAGRGVGSNFVRGLGSGVLQGAQFPVELAGNVASFLGSNALKDYMGENRALLEEQFDPEGIAGTAGEVVGGIAASIPFAGGSAAGTGKAIVRLAPSTRIAKAIALGSKGSMLERVATNVATGLPINALNFNAADQEIPDGASPDQIERIKDANLANRIRNLAIGIGADAVFGALPGHKATSKPAGVPVAGESIQVSPERKAQLDKVSAQNAVKVAEQRRNRIDKALAQSEWQILNPSAEWKELKPEAKKEVYTKWRARRRDSKMNTSTTGNTPEDKSLLVQMEEQLKNVRGERDEARRLSETDTKLGVGNQLALERAAPAVNEDPSKVFIFADVNGLKDVNDALGMVTGDQLLADARDAMLAAHASYGIKPRIFRYGGDELVAIVPKEHAETILAKMEEGSIKAYGTKTGSLSGTIANTLPEALSVEGKAKLISRKIEAKARQGIPGRSREEQVLIDAARERINTQVPPIPVAAEPDFDVTDNIPREITEAVSQVRAAGGLADEASQKEFAAEVNRIYSGPEEARGSELQALVEEHIPIESEPSPVAAKVESTPTPNAPARTVLESVEHPKSLEEMSENQLSRVDDKLTDALDAAKPDTPEHAIIQKDFDAVRDEYKRRNKPQGKPPAATPVKPGFTRLYRRETGTNSSSGERHFTDDYKYADIYKGADDSYVDVPTSDLGKYNPTQSEGKAMIYRLPADIANQRVPYGGTETATFGGLEPVSGPARVETPPRVPDDIARLRRTSPRKMSDSELNTYIEDLEGVRDGARIGGPGFEGEVKDAERRISAALEERAIRAKASAMIPPEVPRSVITGTAGFAYGFTSPTPDDEDGPDRVTNALMWTAIGAGAGLMALRIHAKGRVAKADIQLSDSWPGSKVADEKIVHYSDIPDDVKSWRERAREWYAGTIRRTEALDRAVNVLTGSNRSAEALAAHKNPAKLAAMMGRWISQSESALMDVPVYTDYYGNVVPLNALPARKIVDMVDGDIKGLGKLQVARTSIERGGLDSVPLDPTTAHLIFSNAPENYHKAADAARQFDLAMSSVLENAGVLTPGSSQRFAMEDYYAALHKVWSPDGSSVSKVKDPKTGKMVVSYNPIKGRKHGQTRQVYNPFETSVKMVPQIYRAAELNTIKQRLVELWKAGGSPDHILKQVERRKLPVSTDQALKIADLKKEIPGLSQTDAEATVAAFDGPSLDPRSNVMTVYEEGVLRAYRVDEDIARAMVSLNPDELEGMWKLIGLPAQVARKGVVYNPYFVAKQAFIDNWQATLNSEYGFRPGVDQFLGWLNIVRNTPEYRGYMEAGGGHSTLQSSDYANVKTAIPAIQRGGGGPLEVAVKQLKSLHPIEAWKTLIIPMSESARVGEYLRAKDHGASALDAVWAAKNVTANFQQAGGFTAMRGLSRSAMFLNAGLQGLDRAALRAGVNPFRVPAEGRKAAAAKYLTKAFVGITLPSMYFWMANRDDQQINDLRKTTSGSKYWFVRSPVDNEKMHLKKGDIVKIPKPIVDGQIFGTTMEAALDRAYGDDPVRTHEAVEAVMRDVGVNILPSMGVMYTGLQTGQNMNFGTPIVPEGDQNLALSHQGEDHASWLARTVSKGASSLVGPNMPQILKNSVTPAGLDYIMQSVGGMLGQDGLTAVTQAVEAESKGYVPAKEELPIISKIFAGYPSTNVAPIHRFYGRAEHVQEIGATITHLMKEDPTRLPEYLKANQGEFALVGIFSKARQDIANYRRASQDIKDAPTGTLSGADRQKMIKQFQVLMIETARQANLVASEVDRLMNANKE